MTEVSKVSVKPAVGTEAQQIKKKEEKSFLGSLWSGIEEVGSAVYEDSKELLGLSSKDKAKEVTVDEFLAQTNFNEVEQADKKQVVKETLLELAEVSGDQVAFPSAPATKNGDGKTPTMSLAQAEQYAQLVGLKYNPDTKKFEEKGLLSKAVGAVQDAADVVGTVTGTKQMKASLDRKDATVELMHKDTATIKDTKLPTGYGLASWVGQTAAQPTDVLSAATERITLDKTTEAIDASTQHVKGEHTKNAAKDLLRGISAPIKVHNAGWSAVGGVSDLTSACLKLESITNQKIDNKTMAALTELSNRATDLSIDNVNDMLTALAVTVRLGKTREELKKMSNDEIQAAFKREQQLFSASSNSGMNRAIITRGAADQSAETLMSIYSAYLTNQSNEGLTKLDKAQIAFREGTSEVLNLAPAAVDVASGAIKDSTKGITVLENVGGTVTGALDTVTGSVQSITTLWDGKEGSTKNALKKTGNGLLRFATLGFCGNDDSEEEVKQAKATERPTAAQMQAEKKAEYKQAYNAALSKAYKENLPQSMIDVAVNLSATKQYEAQLAALQQAGDQQAVATYTKNKDAEIATLIEKIRKENAEEIQAVSAQLQQNSEANKKEVKGYVDTIVRNAGGAAHTFTPDVERIAIRATNAASWGTEFQNQMDVTYSNAENPEKNGKLGVGEIAYRFVKGFTLEPLRWAYTKPVTTADEIGIGSLCHISAAVVAGANAADRAGDAIKTYVNNPYNTAASQKAVERGGGAAFWTTFSICFGSLMKGKLILCHDHDVPNISKPEPKTPCDILEEEPWNLVVPE